MTVNPDVEGFPKTIKHRKMVRKTHTNNNRGPFLAFWEGRRHLGLPG